MRTTRSSRRARSVEHKTTNIYTYMAHANDAGGGGGKAGGSTPSSGPSLDFSKASNSEYINTIINP